MFKRHALQVKVVKNPKQTDAPKSDATPKTLTPEQFSHVVKEQMQSTVVLIGAAYTTKVVLDTLREVTLIAAKAKFH